MVVGLGEAAAQVHARILNDPVCQQVLRDKFEDAVKVRSAGRRCPSCKMTLP